MKTQFDAANDPASALAESSRQPTLAPSWAARRPEPPSRLIGSRWVKRRWIERTRQSLGLERADESRAAFAWRASESAPHFSLVVGYASAPTASLAELLTIAEGGPESAAASNSLDR